MRDIIKPIFSTSRYLDDLLNIDNPYFEGVVNLYPPELQLNKLQIRECFRYRSPLFGLHLSLSNAFVSRLECAVLE